MKTKLVRPMFVKIDTKDSLISDRNILTFSDGKIYNPFKNEYYQLILISLDPEDKIEVGDMYLNIVSNEIVKIDFTIDYEQNHCYKVIATQDQLSPDLIYQLVCEYNNGGMQDFEIAITNEPQTDSDLKELLAGKLYLNKPKLTNGFVTVVNKLLMSTETNSDAFDRGFVAGENSVRERLEAVLYNESEVLALCNEAYNLGLLSLKSEIPDLDEMMELDNWFNKNKKK